LGAGTQDLLDPLVTYPDSLCNLLLGQPLVPQRDHLTAALQIPMESTPESTHDFRSFHFRA